MYHYLAGTQEVQAQILHRDEQQCEELHPIGQLLSVASLAAEVE